MLQWTAEAEPTIVSMWASVPVPDPGVYDGRVVELESAKVLSTTGNALWTGSDHSTQLMVAPPEQKTAADIEVGDFVRVQGTLRTMPDAKEAMQTWNISASLEKQLAEEPLYIAATLVQRAGAKGCGCAGEEGGRLSPESTPCQDRTLDWPCRHAVMQ